MIIDGKRAVAYFDILGFKRCYINWYKNLLSLNHDINSYRLKLPYVSDTLMNFYGHRHDLLVKNNCIYLPTLSNDLKYYGKKDVSPGFIEVSTEDKKVSVNHYRVFEVNGVVSVSQGLILKRKLKWILKKKQHSSFLMLLSFNSIKCMDNIPLSLKKCYNK